MGEQSPVRGFSGETYKDKDRRARDEDEYPIMKEVHRGDVSQNVV